MVQEKNEFENCHVYNQNFLGEGVVDGERVAVKDA